MGIHKESGLFKDPRISAMYGFMGYDHDKLYLNYLVANTTIDLKVNIKNIVTPFIGTGPMIGVLIAHNDELNIFYVADKLSPFSYLIINGGVKVYLSEFQVGLKYDYLLDLDNNSSSNGTALKSKTMLVSLIFGYKLK